MIRRKGKFKPRKNITHELIISSDKCDKEVVQTELEKNNLRPQIIEQIKNKKAEIEQQDTVESIQPFEHPNDQIRSELEITDVNFTEAILPPNNFSPPNPKCMKLFDDFSAKVVDFTKPEDAETNSITSVNSSTKSIQLNSGAMIDIPVHQKITYSRRRKIRAKEVSDKLNKNRIGDLQLRDWIYVKPLDGEQKSKFQIMREEHEKIIEAQNRGSQESKVHSPISLDKTDLTTPSFETPVDHFSGIHFKLNETGDLIFHQETINQQIDKTKFLKDSSSKYEEMDKYKRCLVKGNKKSLSNRKWNEKDNELFWKALANVGQDFDLLGNFFSASGSSKTKNQIKNKFKREDKDNSALVDDCLKKAMTNGLKMHDFGIK